MFFFKDINNHLLIFNFFAFAAEKAFLIAHLPKNTEALYFYIFEKEVQYIGRSKNLKKRLKDQAQRIEKSTGFQYDSIGVILSTNSIIEEKHYIEIFNPKFNLIL